MEDENKKEKEKLLYEILINAEAIRVPTDSIRQLSYYTLEDLKYFASRVSSTKSQEAYEFFVKLFRDYHAVTLGDIIPREYINDPIANLINYIGEVRRREHKAIDIGISQRMKTDEERLEKIEKEKDLNYKRYIYNKDKIKRRMKIIKKKERKKKWLNILKWFK